MSRSDVIDLDAIAHRMLADYHAATPGTIFAEGLRLDIPDAWRLQSAVTRLREQRGETVIGYKIGCVGGGNQKMMGLSHPAWGRLWSTEQFADGAVLKKANYANVAFEAEFAIMLNRTFDPEKVSAAEMISAIDAIYPVIEIHNFELRSEKPHGHELIANNAIHAGVIRGSARPVPEPGQTTDLSLIFDRETVDSWSSLQWPSDILSAIVWLAEQQAEAGRQLVKGDLILAGAFGPPIPLGDKTRVDVTSSAFGNVSATFV